MAAVTPPRFAHTVHDTLEFMPKMLREIIIEYAKPLNIFEKHINLIRYLNNNIRTKELLTEESIEQIQILFNDLLTEGIIDKILPQEILLTPAKLRDIIIFRPGVAVAKRIPLSLNDWVDSIRRIRVIALVEMALSNHDTNARNLGLQIKTGGKKQIQHYFLLYKALIKKMDPADNEIHPIRIEKNVEISERTIAWFEREQLFGCDTNAYLDKMPFGKMPTFKLVDE